MHIQINGKRINARRAIAEALSTDIANIEPYQYGKYDAEVDRQLYTEGRGIYAVLPLARNTPDGWRIIAEVSNDTSTVIVIERQ